MTRLASLACGVAALSLCAFGTPTAFTSLDYVQDGLVLQFDAIENAGRGTHDGATTTWRELVSGSENVTLTDGSWSANGLTFTGKVGVGKGAKHNFPSVNRTMEGYVTVPAHLPAFYFGWTRAAGDANRPGLWKEKGKWYLTYFNGGGWDSGKTVTEGDHFWSAAECTSPGDCFFQLDDTEQLATSACGSSSGTTACSLRFNAYGTSSDGNSSYGSNATYRAFRVYSRALSFKERSWNRAVDRVRFSGVTLREAFNGGDEFKGYQVSEDGDTLLVDVAVTNLVAGTAKVKVGDNASGFGVKDPAAYNQPVTVTVIPQGASVTGLRVVWCGLPADATVADDGLTATFSPKAPTDLSVAVFAPTRVWTRGAGTDAFGTAANWANADGTAATAAPGADDVVFVPAAAAAGATFNVTVSVPLDIAALFVGAEGTALGTASVTFAHKGTNVVSGDVYVLTRGTLTHAQISTSANEPKDENVRLDLSIGGNLYVDANGSVSANARGYAAGKGPGKLATGGRYIACHGGGSSPGYAYGSLIAPTNCGCGVVSVGGGAIKLFADGDLTVNGTISADAGKGGSWQSAAGGSVWLGGRRLVGSGRITSHPGWSSIGPIGSGGRIALYLSVQNGSLPGWNGEISARGRSDEGGATWGTAPGTIFLCAAGQTASNGTVIVDGRGISGGYADLAPEVDAGRFGDLVARNKGTAYVREDANVKTSGSVVSTNGMVTGGLRSELEFVGSGTAELHGTNTWPGLVCRTPGKTLLFGAGTGDFFGIRTGATFAMRGEEGNPVTLDGIGGGTWRLKLYDDVVVDVSHVRVSHSDASRGRTVTAYDSDDPDSTTVNWVFSDSPKWGDEITWTGAASTSWNLADNWDPVRVPLAGDRVTIPGDATRMPEITTFDAEVLALTLEAGASLRSLGVALTVSNDVTLAAGASLFLSNGTFTAHADVRQTAGGSFGLMDASLSVASNLLFAAGGTVAFTRAAVDVAGAWTNAASVTCEASSLRVAGVFANPGTLAFAGATRQTLELSRDADFTGGTLAAGVSTVRLAGSVAQTVSPDGVTFDQLTVRKGGGSLRFTDGFSVNSFDVRESGALPIAFAAGEKVTVADLVWRDASLASTAPGTQWLLEVTSAQSALDVTVHDSDARSGLTIYTNGKEPADGNNLGWEFETFFQSWVGGSATDWNNAANWSPAGIPGPTSRVTVVSSAATIVSTVPVTVRGLSVGGDASTAAVTFREAFYCEDSLDVRNRGTVTLNKPSAVTNNVSVRTGGTLTHEQITSTLTKAGQEDKRLDLVCGGDFLVEEGGKVAADGKGFASGKGPSKCYSGGNSRYQACHGGAAQRGYAYGSITAPTNCGSGVASTGGGAIKVFAGGDLRVDGTVTADGNAGSGWQSSAGGSVWLKGRRLIGNGTLAARGGWVSTGPTGSGGRIAVWLSVADGSLPGWSGQITAAGGACGWMTAAGTVYLSGAGEGATNGTLVVDNAGLADGISEAGPSLGLDSVRDVVATNGGRVAFLQNETTSLRGNVYTSGGSNALAGVGATLDLTGPADATIRTEGTFGNVTCTEPGKRIFVSTEPGYHLGLATNATLTLRGGKENPIVLRAAPDPDVEWILHLRAGCQTDVKYVAVSNSNASSGNSVLALDSRDEGGNKNWGFSAEINPGDPITWNGSQGTSWGTAANWTDRAGGHRTPRGTDHVIIPGELSAYPVLTATEGTFTANRLTVEDGGALTLSGAGLIVTNALSVSGTLTVSGTETIELPGNATFARAASFAAGSGRVRLSGEGEQTVDFAGASFVVLEIRKSGGGVTFTGSLTADRFDALTENAVYLAFSRNVTATANSFFCRGRQGAAAGTAALALRGSVQGEKWNLAVRARQYVSGVWVRDSSATGLEMAADALSENAGDNFRWTFGASRTEWTGAADTVFTNAANWYPAVSPGATTEAMIFAPAGVTRTVRAGTPVTLAGLTVGTAGLGNGTIDFRAVAPITVNGDVSVGAGATLTLDSALTNNVVAGNLTMFAGGTLTHSAGKTTEQYALRLEVGGDVAVPTGAVITATGKGYYQSGPGRIIGTDNNKVPSAVYGGSSMNVQRYSYAPPYGSVFEPVRYGSGGSGTGGGIIRLFLGGVLTVGGVIVSEGEYVNAWGSNGGGSVWVKAKRLVGDGTFSVNGSYAPGHGPGAAGGRLCVELADREPLTDWTGTMTSRAVPDGLKAYGHLGAGTVLVRTGRGTSVLSIDNGLDATTGQDVTDLPAPDDSPRRSYRKTSVVVRDGGWLRVAGDVTVADLDLASANTKVMLETNTLTVLTSAHRDGRGWHPDAQVTCTTNATTGAYGKIVWRQPGTLVIVR